MPKTVPICLLALMCCCANLPLSDLESLSERFESKALPTAEQFPRSDAVTLIKHEKAQLCFGADGYLDYTTTVHVARRVFRNTQEYATVSIPLYYEEELAGINAQTIHENGTIVRLDKDDFYTIEGRSSDEMLYSDLKTVRFTFPALQPNSVIEYRYRKCSGPAIFLNEYTVQEDIPVLACTFELEIPSMVLALRHNWQYKTYGSGGSDTILWKEGLNRGSKVAVFQFTDIPAFCSEPFMPPDNLYRRNIRFRYTERDTWDKVAERYWKQRFGPEFRIDEDVNAKAKSLVGGCTSQREMIRRVYDYVQSFRYVALDAKNSGWRPNRPARIMEREYGDCKDKTMLIVALLTALGIDCRPALCMTSDKGIIDASFPSLFFNHMICVASLEDDTGAIWMDATSKYLPPGKLPWPCEGIDALVLSPEGQPGLARTPTSTAEENACITRLNVAVSDTSVTFDYDVLLRGVQGSRVRSVIDQTGMNEEEFETYLRRHYLGDIAGARIDVYTHSQQSKAKNSIRLTFRASVPATSYAQGRMLAIPVSPFEIESLRDWGRLTHREYPLFFRYLRMRRDSMTVTFDPGRYQLVQQLDKSEVDNEWFLHVFRSHSRPGTISTNRLFALTQILLGADDYSSFRHDVHKVLACEKRKILLRRSQ